MKEKLFTAISTVLIFFPFTIFPIRWNPWALESPAAEIIILVYIAVMIVGGIFTITAYTKGKVKNNLMKICLVVHGVYIAGGVAMLAMMGATNFHKRMAGALQRK